jgi:hypothetical protein
MLGPATPEEKMNAAVRWLRISYWVGAVVDAVAAAEMLLAPLSALGRAGFVAGSDVRYAMGMGASLMAGWTALLLWADRDPMERRGVLPLTAAVVAALAANEVAGVRSGLLPLASVVPIWMLQACLAALFLWSYAVASRAVADLRSSTGGERLTSPRRP